ncbi:hypothetical protein FHR84_000636 [Actinopolyspora biskrensis]|uniref:Uncharacterized protein n=1 Tax=Actinopolyspora biskrensis TaxID=1470178 RepID=A0A852YUA7_9ACTN|nr:hypothetical protein [Actinopolyspora biskrensis]NYH77322.1 hypothetical protein [Actinopolyspora biskrensis]
MASTSGFTPWLPWVFVAEAATAVVSVGLLRLLPHQSRCLSGVPSCRCHWCFTATRRGQSRNRAL